jgi:hypothetical protein
VRSITGKSATVLLIYETQTILSSFSSLWHITSESSSMLRRALQVTMLQADGMVSQSLQQEHGYGNAGQIGMLEGAKELGYGTYQVQLRMLP